MPKTEIPFVGQAYNMSATQLDAQASINWYIVGDQTGKFKKALFDRPGLTLFVDDESQAEVRGLYSLKDVTYAVIDNTLYTIEKNGSKKNVGTLDSTVGRVSIVASNTQIFISDGSDGYVYQLVDSDTRTAGDFFKIQNASSTIGPPNFVGTGLNDLSTSGTYTGDSAKTYRVQIDSTGATDTFKWSEDGGQTFVQTNVSITGTNQLLSDGVFIQFLNTDLHTLNDFWDIPITIDSAFYPPVIAAYQDGYGIYVRQNTNRFYISSINDFSVVDPLDFALANIYPDNLVAAVSIHEELWLVGQDTTEIFYNTGNQDFPFEPRTNLVINYGSDSPWSIRHGADNVIFMLARNKDGDRVFVRIANYDVEIISTEPINEEITDYDDVSDAYSMLIEKYGHLFYITTFPKQDKTWVYDATLNAWHEWRSYRPNVYPYANPLTWGAFRGNVHTVFDGKDLIGDSRSGKIFFLDRKNKYDYDQPITCERTTQNIQQNLQLITINSLQVDMESGVGLTTGQGGDPQLMLQISRDGGKTWGAEMWRSAGKKGKYANRALWYRLGTTQGRVMTYRLRITDPVDKVILGAVADIDIGD